MSQYGRSGEVRFIVIDHMLSNGYESWLWDGWAEAGGWSSDGNTIVQVRSAYTDGPLNALRRARPGPTRDRFLADIERAAIEERAVLGRDGVGQLLATGDRLSLQAWEQIAARVGDDDSAFIAESWRATNQTSINRMKAAMPWTISLNPASPAICSSIAPSSRRSSSPIIRAWGWPASPPERRTARRTVTAIAAC